MSNTTNSPFMLLPVPVVGTDPGPDWANNLNACLAAIDSHDHSTDKGAPITGPINGSAITGGTIDDTPIGATTPSTGAFASITIGSFGPFLMKRFTGTNASSAHTQLLAPGYTAFYGAIGASSSGGAAAVNVGLGTGSFSFTSPSWNYLSIGSVNGVIITNADDANSNLFDVTIFYVP